MTEQRKGLRLNLMEAIEIKVLAANPTASKAQISEHARTILAQLQARGFLTLDDLVIRGIKDDQTNGK